MEAISAGDCKFKPGALYELVVRFKLIHAEQRSIGQMYPIL
jgi:hypothetical protein